MSEDFNREMSPLKKNEPIIEPAFMGEPDFNQFPLEALYHRQAEIEKRLDELRRSEPPRKRRDARKQELWFHLCSTELDELRRVRDAIISKKEENAAESAGAPQETARRAGEG